MLRMNVEVAGIALERDCVDAALLEAKGDRWAKKLRIIFLYFIVCFLY